MKKDPEKAVKKRKALVAAKKSQVAAPKKARVVVATKAQAPATTKSQVPAPTKAQVAAPEEIATPDPDFKKLPINAAYLKKAVHRRTRGDRFEAGRALRAACPREDHAEFTVSRPRRKDPIKLLIASSEGRLEELLPIRYGRMLASPFAFFRGSAIIMASDLSKTAASGYAVQACGDCHLMNFGAFATPERNIVFDINDFDETFPAPWEWDLKRLAASFVIASRHNGHNDKSSKATTMRLVSAYRDRLTELATMPALAAWYAALDWRELIDLTTDSQLRRKQKKRLESALARDSLHEFVRLGQVVDQAPKIKDDPPLIYHHPSQNAPEYEEQVRHAMALYRESLAPERRVLLDRYELRSPIPVGIAISANCAT